jgi:hypothetical protein
MRNCGAYLNNAVSLDEYFARLYQPSVSDIKQASRV